MTAFWRKVKEVDVNTFDNYLCIQLVLPDNPWKAVVIQTNYQQNSCTGRPRWELAAYSKETIYAEKLHIAHACVLNLSV